MRLGNGKWSVYGIALLFVSLVGLTIYSVFGFQAPVPLFFLHAAFGIAVTELLTGWSNISASSWTNKLSVFLAFGMFGISDFLWGGRLIGHDVKSLLPFAGFSAVGFFIIILGDRNRL